MAKWRVLRACTFKGKYYEEGGVVTLDNFVVPPHHFVKVEDYAAPVIPKDDIMAPKPMSFGKPVKMPMGFAANLDAPVQNTKGKRGGKK